MGENLESRNPVDFVHIAEATKRRKSVTRARARVRIGKSQEQVAEILHLNPNIVVQPNKDAEIIGRVVTQSTVVPTINHFTSSLSFPKGIEGEEALVSIDKKTLIILPEKLVTQYPFASICQGKQEILLERLRGLDFSDRKRALLEFPEGKISIKNGDTIHEITLDQKVLIGEIVTSLSLFIPGSPLFH